MSDHARPDARWWQGSRARVFALLGILVLLFAFIGLDLGSGRRLDAELARLEQRYGSLDGRAAVAPPVASSDNQARFVRAAAALVAPTGRDPGGTAVITALAEGLGRGEHKQEGHDVPRDPPAFVEANAGALA